MFLTDSLLKKPFHRHYQTLILSHGTRSEIIHSDLTFSTIESDQLESTLSRQPRPLLLLASPFFHSFVHETIHLTRKELRQADQQVLQVSHTPLRNRFVTSIQISEEKAITIHSHLSPQGVALIQRLREKRVKVYSRPAIQTIIQNYLSSYTRGEETPHFQLFFEDEALHIHGHPGRPVFDLLYYWNRESPQREKVEQMKRLFSEGNDPSTPILLCFRERAELPQARKLFFPGKTPQKYKIVTASRRRRPRNIHKIIKPIPLLTLSAILLLCWAVLSNLRLSRQIRKKQTLIQSLQSLERNTNELMAIAEIERGYYKLRSLKMAMREVKARPHLLLERVEQILPSGVWIHTLTITPQSIFIILLDSGETEITKLLEQLNVNLGKTNLEKNETLQINARSLKQYHLRINDFSLDILR